MGGRASGVLMLMASLTVLLALYVGIALFVGRQLPARAEVAGVNVGGLGTQEAEQRLARRVEELETTPVTLVMDGTRKTLVPSESGLHVDVSRTLQGATGFSLDPREVWNRLAGGGEYPLVGRVETGRLSDIVREVATDVDRPLVEGAISFQGAQVDVVRSAAGRTVDVAGTVSGIEDRWPQQREFEAVIDTQAPTVSPQEMDRLVEEVADRAVAAPLVLLAGDRRISVPVAEFAPALRMNPAGSTLTLALDEEAFAPVVDKALARVLTEPVDAGLRVVGDRVEVTPAREGLTVRMDLTAENAASVLTRTERREAAVAISRAQPRLTTETVQAWKVGRRVATAQIDELPPAAAANARRALEALEGTVVPPGTRFSLADHLGPRTEAAGYVAAPTGGEPAHALAGGVDHVASALYEAAFRAGLTIEGRVSPAVHLAGTTDGLDAVLTGADLALTTTAGQAVLVSATSTDRGGSIALWAARPSGVAVEIGERRDVVPPGPAVTEASPDCVADAGEVGFRVTVTRTVPQEGGEDRRESHEVGYRPRQPHTCLPQVGAPTG